MPIEWSVSTETRRVEAMWSGRVSAADWAAFIADMRRTGATGYAKLHDLSHASVDINPAQIRELARMTNAAADDGALGPVAFVLDSARALELVMQFEDGTESSLRPIAVFPTRQLASEWLDGLASGD
ncbi:MAG: hypothetical protein KF889_17900 [Alphaproteobacteria bacterium]|nr:hypothetical protein [Alphaproteobacteria bacterium]MCW5741328.1 hypothetical protein [Alphaproteobacteria bacterium]